MAQIIQKKFPIDLEPRKAIGFGFPLNGDAVFKPTYQTRDQIKANLVNFLLTNKGERVFRPDFGGDLRSLLFENIVNTSLDELQQKIEDDISAEFPLVDVRSLDFTNEEDNNTINFELTYDVRNFGVTDSLNILIQ